MRIPGVIARPLFALLYRLSRPWSAGAPIRRAMHAPSSEQRAAYDGLLSASLERNGDGAIDYQLPYPKSDFLNYLCDWRGYVLHGSPLVHLTVLEPIRLSTDTTEFGKRQQVFASPDAMWAMWFAILDKARVNKTDNGCVRVGQGPGRIKLCHFDLPRDARAQRPFVDGMMYLARPEDFPDRRSDALLNYFDAEVEEWGSAASVRPLAKIAVKPDDFPYLGLVRYRL